MRKLMGFGVAFLGLGMIAGVARAEDAKVSGVLIDQSCAAKKGNEAAAASHSKACTLKCADKAGFAIISGNDIIKLDAGSADKAKAYLAKDDATTKVTITGTKNADGSMTVASIEATK
jgi:hypothetical protein